MKPFFKILSLLVLGFIGGVIAILFTSLFSPTKINNASDAVSIANTYIVFTTIIFVGFTVILGVASYVFTQQFSNTKENQINSLLNELEQQLKTDEQIGIKFITNVLSNKDVTRHVSTKLEEKINQTLTELKANRLRTAEQAKQECDTIDGIADQLAFAERG